MSAIHKNIQSSSILSFVQLSFQLSPSSFSMDNPTEHELLLNQPPASTDINLHTDPPLSDAHKLELLSNSWVPGADYAMLYSTCTKNGKEDKRSIKHMHLKKPCFYRTHHISKVCIVAHVSLLDLPLERWVRDIRN